MKKYLKPQFEAFINDVDEVYMAISFGSVLGENTTEGQDGIYLDFINGLTDDKGVLL